MSASPPNAHAISAIRERLAKVSGELIAVEKEWRTLREAHYALSQTLRMFDQDADSYPVKPRRPYKRVLPYGEKLGRLVIDALRVSERPMATPELVIVLGEHASAVPDAARRVQATLNYLARSRRIAKEGKRQSAKWSRLRLGTADSGQALEG
jgi:hypothetical protein